MLNRLAAVVVVLLAFTSLAGAQAAADAGLTKGIAQVQDGHWADAVSTLNDVVKRLKATAPPEDLAQAYLWLGIAYAQLDSEERGAQSFREALSLDDKVSLAEGWPAKVSRLFAEEAVYRKAKSLDGLTDDEGEVLLRDWMARHPKSLKACRQLAEYLSRRSFWRRPSPSDDEVEIEERCLALDDPKDPTSPMTLARENWQRIYADSGYDDSDGQKERHADLGLEYASLALKIEPNLIDAIIIKRWLLREKAQLAKDEKKRKEYLYEADLMRGDARGRRKSGKGEFFIGTGLYFSMVERNQGFRQKAALATDVKKRDAYLYEANLLRDDAKEFRKSVKGEFSGAEPPFFGTGPLPPAAHPPAVDPAVGAVIAAVVARAFEKPGGVTGVPGGVVGSVVGGLPDAPPPHQAVRVGGQIKEPKKLKNVPAVYTDIAKQARVQGVVILECTISPQGNVVDVKIIRGIQLLDAAAIDAVRQWIYQPTLLNGVPVPVIMTVTVNFRLS